jgi:2'-5' RNA ligase
MRLFFAVTLPEEAREAVARVQRELQVALGDNGIRWVKPEQFHYTLKFLGETPEVKVSSAIEAAREVAAQFTPFRLTIAHVGGLPRPDWPKTLYACVDFAGESFPLMRRLTESLDSALVKRGFPPETRGSFPHLTLGRIRSPEGAHAAKRLYRTRFEPLQSEGGGVRTYYGEYLKVDKIAVFVVDSFVLMQSELRPDGPIYTVLETFPLAMT